MMPSCGTQSGDFDWRPTALSNLSRIRRIFLERRMQVGGLELEREPVSEGLYSRL